MKRHRHTSHLTNITGPHAASIDHIISGNIASVSCHASDPAICLGDAGDLHALMNLYAKIARASGQCLGDIHRIGLAVFWQPDTANNIGNR